MNTVGVVELVVVDEIVVVDVVTVAVVDVVAVVDEIVDVAAINHWHKGVVELIVDAIIEVVDVVVVMAVVVVEFVAVVFKAGAAVNLWLKGLRHRRHDLSNILSSIFNFLFIHTLIAKQFWKL